jgi:hypothetical protein
MNNIRILIIQASDHEAETGLQALMGKRELTVRELKAFRKRAQRCHMTYSFPAPEGQDK